MLGAARLAVDGGMQAPVFRVESSELIRALASPANLPDAAPLGLGVRELLEQLTGYRVERVAPLQNPARPVALAPLIDWLPERARKAEELRVQQLDQSHFEVDQPASPDSSTT